MSVISTKKGRLKTVSDGILQYLFNKTFGKISVKRIISLLLLACPILASAAPDNDKASVQAVIARYYNRPLAAHKCQLAKPPKDSETASDNIMYCMKPVADHTVTRNGKATRYVFATGFAYDMQQKSKTGRPCFFGSGRIVCFGESRRQVGNQTARKR